MRTICAIFRRVQGMESFGPNDQSVKIKPSLPGVLVLFLRVATFRALVEELQGCEADAYRQDRAQIQQSGGSIRTRGCHPISVDHCDNLIFQTK